jgi:hypothetical protein
VPKIWIHKDLDTGEYFMCDQKLFHQSAGPIEISYELYERVREAEREMGLIQDILEDLEYEWEYPEDGEENVRDCD